MSDDRPIDARATAFSPPTYGVSQFSVRFSAQEVGVTLGHTRVIIDPETGFPGTQLGIEWLGTFSMSPTAMFHLHQMLGEVIQDYERTVGRIPRDPSANVGREIVFGENVFSKVQ